MTIQCPHIIILFDIDDSLNSSLLQVFEIPTSMYKFDMSDIRMKKFNMDYSSLSTILQNSRENFWKLWQKHTRGGWRITIHHFFISLEQVDVWNWEMWCWRTCKRETQITGTSI